MVGGGWAGVSAAMHAAQRGWSVLLLEQGSKLGGRATSFEGPPGSAAVDNGQHLFLGAYTETLALLGLLGTAESIRFESPLRIPTLMADGRLEPLRSPGLPGPAGAGPGPAALRPAAGAATRPPCVGWGCAARPNCCRPCWASARART